METILSDFTYFLVRGTLSQVLIQLWRTELGHLLGLWLPAAMSPSFSEHVISARRSSGLAGLPGFVSSLISELGSNSGSSWMSGALNFHLAMLLLNAVKCHLRELTTKSVCAPLRVREIVIMHMRQCIRLRQR